MEEFAVTKPQCMEISMEKEQHLSQGQSSLLRLPPEIREHVYMNLIDLRQNPKAFNPGDSLPRKSFRRGSYENWYSGEDSLDGSGLFNSSTSDFRAAVILMRTCHQLHDEVSHLMYSRLVWHAKLSVFHVPSLPLQFCGPRYATLVNHFRILLRSEVALCMPPLQAMFMPKSLPNTSESRKRVQGSSLYQNARSFCQLLADSQKHVRRAESPGQELQTTGVESGYADMPLQGQLVLHVEAQMAQEPDVVHSMQIFKPLRGFVREVHVGALCYRDGPPNKPDLNKVVSNAAYLELKDVFGDEVEWKFPSPAAQYKE